MVIAGVELIFTDVGCSLTPALNKGETMEKHIHKLRRHRFKTGNIVYFCATEDCRYKVAPSLSIGKKVLCWRCGNPFVMNEYSIRLAKPHCDSCHRAKDADAIVVMPIPPQIQAPQPVKLESLGDLRSRLANAGKHRDETDDDI